MGNQENEMLQPSFCAGGKKKKGPTCCCQCNSPRFTLINFVLYLLDGVHCAYAKPTHVLH